MRSSVPAYLVSEDEISSVIPSSWTLSNPLVNSELTGAAIDPEARIGALFDEKRRSILIVSSPLTRISPFTEIVDSPRARSLEVIVLKSVILRSSGVRNESLATS